MVSSKGKERASVSLSESEDDAMDGSTPSSARPTNTNGRGGGGATQHEGREEVTMEEQTQRTKDTRAGYRKLEAESLGEWFALVREGVD